MPEYKHERLNELASFEDDIAGLAVNPMILFLLDSCTVIMEKFWVYPSRIGRGVEMLGKSSEMFENQRDLFIEINDDLTIVWEIHDHYGFCSDDGIILLYNNIRWQEDVMDIFYALEKNSRR
jgi:hypothetical protein